MQKPAFESLLEEMPRIAEAVKLFPEGALRERAFEALVESFNSKQGPAKSDVGQSTTSPSADTTGETNPLNKQGT